MEYLNSGASNNIHENGKYEQIRSSEGNSGCGKVEPGLRLQTESWRRPMTLRLNGANCYVPNRQEGRNVSNVNKPPPREWRHITVLLLLTKGSDSRGSERRTIMNAQKVR